MDNLSIIGAIVCGLYIVGIFTVQYVSDLFFTPDKTEDQNV